jgi:protein TonB
MPLILGLLPNSDGDDTLDTKIVSIKLRLKKEEIKKIFHHHHRHTKVDQVKFVKPVVAKTERR